MNYKEQANDLKESGELSEWAYNHLMNNCCDGVTDELWAEAVSDMKVVSKLGINSSEDYRKFFYIDNFIEDLAEEILGKNLSEKEEEDAKVFMFGLKETIQYNNLLDFRVALLKWVQSKTVKSAAWHTRTRNNSGFGFMLHKYDLSRWSKMAVAVNNAVVHGVPKSLALEEITSELPNDEKYNFLSWYSFTQGQNKNLYDINTKIKNMDKGAKLSKIKTAGIYEDSNSYFIPKFKNTDHRQDKNEDRQPSVQSFDEQKAEDFNTVRSKMVSRTFAIDKLLEKYKDVLNEKQIDEIEDALNSLRKKVRKLKMASTVNDCFAKTAGILKKNKFDSGAQILEEIITKKAITEAKSADLEDLLAKLYKISDELKRRDMVRGLAEIDLALYKLNIAGFFPELTDAQSKLIDAYGYASNKVQDVIPRLRSGITQGGGVSITLDNEESEEDENNERAEQISELAKAIERPV